MCAREVLGGTLLSDLDLNLQIIGCFEPMSRDYLATKGHNSKILNRHGAKIYFTSDFSQKRSLMPNVCLLLKKDTSVDIILAGVKTALWICFEMHDGFKPNYDDERVACCYTC